MVEQIDSIFDSHTCLDDICHIVTIADKLDHRTVASTLIQLLYMNVVMHPFCRHHFILFIRIHFLTISQIHILYITSMWF